MTTFLRFPGLIAAAVLIGISGCTYFGLDAIHPGQTMAEVRSAAGTPTLEHTLADGTPVWYYSALPTGTTTYRVQFDSSGRVSDYRQVLTRKHFDDRIFVGRTTRRDLTDEFGPPAEVQTYRNLNQVVWTYRSMHGTFVYITDVHIDLATGVVTEYETYRDRNRDFT